MNEGLLSDTFECKSGVKQGDVMRPYLFNTSGFAASARRNSRFATVALHI